MVLRIINDTHRRIHLTVENRSIEIGEILEINTIENKVSMTVSNLETSRFQEDNAECFITTDVSFELLCYEEITVLTLSNYIRKYQNNTKYDYFVPLCANGEILHIRYDVNDKNGVEENIKGRLKKTRAKRILSAVGWCLWNALLDGGVLYLILWIVWGWRVALIGLAIFFIFEWLVHILFQRLGKSRHRALNWVKEPNSFDDVGYLIRHIQKFCKN